MMTVNKLHFPSSSVRHYFFNEVFISDQRPTSENNEVYNDFLACMKYSTTKTSPLPLLIDIFLATPHKVIAELMPWKISQSAFQYAMIGLLNDSRKLELKTCLHISHQAGYCYEMYWTSFCARGWLAI